MRKKVLVLLAEGFEEIEAIVSIDILRRAGLDVTVAGVGDVIVKGSRNIVVKADMEIGSYKGLPDALVLPGGAQGVSNLSRSKIVKDLINKTYKNGKIIAAICAAPSIVLGPMNILKGKKATCYPSDASILRDKAKYVDKNVVVDGNIITSKGPGTTFDFALKLVEVLAGKSVKETVRKKTLYELNER